MGQQPPHKLPTMAARKERSEAKDINDSGPQVPHFSWFYLGKMQAFNQSHIDAVPIIIIYFWVGTFYFGGKHRV